MPGAQRADNGPVPAHLSSILKIEVPVSVQIASRLMRVREVANLSPGAIIELPKLSDEELEVMIGNRRIGTGMAVKVGENFGVRITHMGTLRQRISALAPERGEPAVEAPNASPAINPSVSPEALHPSSESSQIVAGQ